MRRSDEYVPFTDRPTPHVEQLRKLAARNVVINATLSHYQHGNFPSLEAALVQCLVNLDAENQRLSKAIFDDMLNNPMRTMIRAADEVPTTGKG